VPQTNERAFETYVETILREKSRWLPGDLADWDEARAFFPARIQIGADQLGHLDLAGLGKVDDLAEALDEELRYAGTSRRSVVLKIVNVNGRVMDAEL